MRLTLPILHLLDAFPLSFYIKESHAVMRLLWRITRGFPNKIPAAPLVPYTAAKYILDVRGSAYVYIIDLDTARLRTFTICGAAT